MVTWLAEDSDPVNAEFHGESRVLQDWRLTPGLGLRIDNRIRPLVYHDALLCMDSTLWLKFNRSYHKFVVTQDEIRLVGGNENLD